MKHQTFFSKILNGVVVVSILFGPALPVAAMGTSVPTPEPFTDLPSLKNSAYDPSFFDPMASSLADIWGGAEDSLLFGEERQVPLEPLPRIPSRPSSSISQPALADPLAEVGAILSQFNGANLEKPDLAAFDSLQQDAKSQPTSKDPFAFLSQWFAPQSNTVSPAAGQADIHNSSVISPTAPVSPTVGATDTYFLYLPSVFYHPPDGSESATFQPNQKSSASFAGGNVGVSAPAGVFSQTVRLTYQPLSLGAVVGHPHTLRSFDLTAQAGATAVSHFNAPLSISVRYTDQLDLDESLLHLFYLDSKRNVWVGVPSVVDMARNVVTATVNHFTTFALMDVIPCDELIWEGLLVELQPVFSVACKRVGAELLGGPGWPAYQLGGAWIVDFDQGSLIYNASENVAYYVNLELLDAYFSAGGPGGWLGLPVSDTNASGLPETYQDEFHDFRNQPYNTFEYGFVGINSLDNQAGAYWYFPQVVRVYKSTELVEEGTDPDTGDPTYKARLTLGGEFDPAPESLSGGFARAWLFAEFSDGTPPWVEHIDVSRETNEVTYPETLPLTTTVKFHWELDRGEFYPIDNLIGYAPCLYSDLEIPYGPFSMMGYFEAEVGCGPGGPGADTTPPVISYMDLFQDGKGGVAVRAEVTDNVGVALVKLYFNGTEYIMQPIGGNLYEAAIPNGPRSGTNTYKIYAEDFSSNFAWFPDDGSVISVPASQAMNFGDCIYKNGCPMGYVGIIGDPVNTQNGNFTWSGLDVFVAGIGASDLIVRRAHNTLAAFGSGGGITRFTASGGTVSNTVIAGPPPYFGRGWTFPYAVALVVVDNLLMKGVQVFYPDGRVVNFVSNGDGTYAPTTPFSYDVLAAVGGGYELRNKRTLEEDVFDAKGRLVAHKDRNGNTVSLSYSGDLLTRVENASGRALTFEFNAEGYITAIHGSEGKTVRYEYANGNLVKVIDARGDATLYTYNADNQLTQITLPKGNSFIRLTYDDQKRVSQQILGATEANTLAYAEGVTTMTDAYGNWARHSYDSDGRLIQAENAAGSEYYGYDTNFNRVYFKDRNGQEYFYTHDDRGNVLTVDGPDGFHQEWRYNDRDQMVQATEQVDASTTRATMFVYDDHDNPTKVCNALNTCTTITYDARGLPVDVQDFGGNHIINIYDVEGDLAAITNAETETMSFDHDDLGRMVAIHRPLGQVYNYAYDPEDHLVAVSGPLGFQMSYRFDANDNLEAMVDPNGGETLYAYNDSDKVVTITNPLDFTTSAFTYGLMNEVTSATDAESRVWAYEYDALLRVVAAHGPEDTHLAWAYDAVGNVTEVTDAEERIAHTVYDALNRPTAITRNYRPGVLANADTNVTTTYEYDLIGNVLRMVDPENNPTVYEYDLLGRMMLKRSAETQEWKYEYDPMGNLTLLTNPRQYDTIFSYDRVYRLKTIKDAKDNITTFIYDKDGNRTDIIDPNDVVTHFEYNELDRLVHAIRNYRPGQPADSQTNVTTSYEHDLAGNLRFVTDPRSFQAEFRYDAAMRLIETFDYEDAHTVMTYDKVNNLLTVTDDNDHTTTYGYDDLDRRVSVTNPETHTVTFAYNKVGDLIELVDANQNHTRYDVDALGRVTRRVDALQGEWLYTYNRVGNILVETDANDHATTYTFDKVYRLLSSTDAENHTTSFQWDPNDNLVELIDGNDHHTFYGYDQLDRLTSTTNPEDETTHYGYDALGNQTELIEADDTITRYAYDPLYRLASVTENYVAGGPANDDTNVITYYAYDAAGNLTRFINANTAVTQFEYDGMGRLTREIDPLTNTWTYTYDGVGNRLTRRDANNKLTTYSYYPDDQPRQIVYENGTSVAFAYDPNNNRTTMQDSLGITTWTYDALNRVTDVVDPFNRALHTDYDPVSNRTGLTYPDGNAVAYTYYKNNWLKTMVAPESNLTSYERDGVGNLTHITNPNSTVTDLTYDKADRVLTLTNQQIVGAQKTNSAYAYTYNEVGHVTQIVNTYGWRQPDTVTETYTYDGLHRLAGMQNSEGVAMSYAYDKVGNRQTWTTNDDLTSQTPLDGFTATYAYNAANQLLSVGVVGDQPIHDMTVTFRYDANGNRINKEWNGPQAPPVQGVDYTYDPENRLTIAQDYQLDPDKRVDRAITTLDYDGDGRRLVQTYDPKTDNGGQKRTEYTFDGLDPVAEYSMLNGQRDNFYRGAGGRIETMHHFPAGTPGQMFWYDYNFKGDVVGLTKQDGQSIHNYRYDPYGGVVPDTGNFTDPHNHYTLTGKEFDENTGLVYFGTRHYDPKMGVWATQDSYRGVIGYPPTGHRYLYVLGNPTTLYDLYGEHPVVVALAAILKVAAPHLLAMGVGAVEGVSTQFVGDVIGNVFEYGADFSKYGLSGWESYVASGFAGAIAGELLYLKLDPKLVGAIEGALEPVFRDMLIMLSKGKSLSSWCWENTLRDALVNAAFGAATASINIIPDSPSVRGKIAKGLNLFVSKRAIQEYKDIPKEVVNAMDWKILERVAKAIDSGLLTGDLCAQEIDTCNIGSNCCNKNPAKPLPYELLPNEPGYQDPYKNYA